MSVVLHVGLPKTGTTYLQRLLADHRDQLREAGVLYPFVRPGGMFEGAVEVRGSAAKFGLDADRIAGTWAELCERARGFDGTTVISHEVLGGATTAQIDAALAPLEGLEVHVVVTARDLGRQATAHWQEEVKLGATMSFADFERDQLRADTGPDQGPDAGGVRPHFWHAQDFADALRRWGRHLPPERTHLVIVPRPGVPPVELWHRFADAAGIGRPAVQARDEAANRSLASADIALLREVNGMLAGTMPVAERNRIVKREWAEGELALRDGDRPAAPAGVYDVLARSTQAWYDDVVAAGRDIRGDRDDLDPVVGAPGKRVDVPPRAGDDPHRIAKLLLQRQLT